MRGLMQRVATGIKGAGVVQKDTVGRWNWILTSETAVVCSISRMQARLACRVGGDGRGVGSLLDATSCRANAGRAMRQDWGFWAWGSCKRRVECQSQKAGLSNYAVAGWRVCRR